MKKQRLFYLDLIRAVALVCILVIHFNAAVTGYFTLPSKLFGSVLPFNIYLGDFGSSLFFMVSGAALQYTSPGQGREPLNLARFYQKRAKAVYPMFWLAWCIFFPIRFVTKPGYYAAAKTPSLLLTVLGLDNFAQAAGWVTMDFACVGEWFLGSILFLYLLFPLLRWGLRKQPLLTWAVVLAASLPVHYMGWDARLVAIHIPESCSAWRLYTGSARRALVCWPGVRYCCLPPLRRMARWPVRCSVPRRSFCWPHWGAASTGCRCKMRVRSSASILMRSF